MIVFSDYREGRPSVYASEARPPAVVSDHLAQRVFYAPPSDGSGSGLRGFIRNLLNFFWSVCYGTVVTILQIGRRLLGADVRGGENFVILLSTVGI